jgi:hypothetical protein
VIRLILTHLILFLSLPLAWAGRPSYVPNEWPEVKGTHFIVIYSSEIPKQYAADVLASAERFYSSIAEDIGYARYSNYWTWEERVSLVIFKDKDEYTQRTHQPLWSLGFASMHNGLYKFRNIVAFKDQENFLTELLPHEISHLILHDFIGFERSIPLFFDEGVAQMAEVRDASIKYENILAHMITQGKTIPLEALILDDIRQEQDVQRVAIFYAESLYIIDFLVKTYGKEKFRDLCCALRDGKNFEDAFRSSYSTIGSIKALETQWIKYMMQYI